MFRGHYDNWRTSRMNGIKKYISPEYFKDKTLLELGAGHGDVGNLFYKLGAIVTSSDARVEHLRVINRKYPHLNTLQIDCDNDNIKCKYDIIVHWGVLYHLNEIEIHLEKISQKCDILLLETEVSDSNDNQFYISTFEKGYDQAFNRTGIRPSAQYVERILEKNGFQFKLIKDPILNSGCHCYDWEINATNTWKHGLRRFWICWKNIDSILII
jgi:hypothetical protein